MTRRPEATAGGGDDLIGEATHANPREERINLRLTQLERAKFKRAAGQMALSDWARQALLAAADGDPARPPNPDAAAARRQDQVMIRLGVRMARLEALTLALIEIVLGFGVNRTEVEKMAARDHGARELEQFLRRFESDPRHDEKPSELDTSLREIKAALRELSERFTEPPPATGLVRRITKRRQ